MALRSGLLIAALLAGSEARMIETHFPEWDNSPSDGRLSRSEALPLLEEAAHHLAEYHHSSSGMLTRRAPSHDDIFAQLDKDNDGYLSRKECMPLLKDHVGELPKPVMHKYYDHERAKDEL